MMKAMLLVEGCMTSNKDWNPPDPRGGVEAQMAYYEYCATVPHSLTLAPGTILDGVESWKHCLPLPVPELAATQKFARDDFVNEIPYMVRAIPADEQSRRVVDFKAKQLPKEYRDIYDRFQQRIPELLKQYGLVDPLAATGATPKKQEKPDV
jgi:hypothetical protein